MVDVTHRPDDTGVPYITTALGVLGIRCDECKEAAQLDSEFEAKDDPLEAEFRVLEILKFRGEKISDSDSSAFSLAS
jgi:hypothetical protein